MSSTPAVIGRERRWYRGDCHVHSASSHGSELTPGQLASAARAVGLDFVVATDHNTAEGHEAWAALGSDDLLVLFGQEVVTRTGHWLALGLDAGHVIAWDYGVRDAVVERYLTEVRRVGGLCVAAHPYAPYDAGTFMYPYREFDVVEVWNGPWTSELPWQADNEAALAEWGRGLAADVNQGRWLPAMGNSDAHLDGQIGVPRTVVAAEDFSAGALLAGIRAGRSWIAESAAVEFSFVVTVDGRRAEIGESLETGGAAATARVLVRGVPEGIVTFHTETGVAHRAVLPDSGAGDVRWQVNAADAGFVRVEVRHPGGRMAALSNPIVLF